MKRLLALAVVSFAFVNACSDSGAPLAPPSPEQDLLSVNHVVANVARVTNQMNSGPGSFRQAIMDANANSSITKIDFSHSVNSIALVDPVTYSGSQSLRISGNRAIIDGTQLPAGASGFLATGGSNLEIRDLTFREAPGPGVTVAVPATASGTVKVVLFNVSATENGSHGILINDQAEYFSDPNSTSPNGSNASLDVTIVGGRFERNGFTALDQDGIRLNEGGPGDLRAVVTGVRVESNGGDGVEFDERSTGDIRFSVIGSALNKNGGFDAADFDDGIDLDEAGDGSIVGNFVLTSANENFEQGIDLNENDAGDLRVDMTLVEAIGNNEEGIEYEEDDDSAGGGSIVATLTGIKARDNGEADGDAGLKLREKGAGDLQAKLALIESSNNQIGGVLLREDADGSLTGQLQNVVASGNSGDGIELDENSTGDLTVALKKGTANNNAAAGIRADQGSAGVGALQLAAFSASGNVSGAIVANAGVTVTQVP